MMQSLVLPLWLGLFAARNFAMAAVLGNNATRLRSCKQNPRQTSYGKDACPCVGIDNLKGYYATQEKFIHVQRAAETGASCEAWDEGKHPECRGSVTPQWCKQSWCYIDPCNCNIDVLPKMSTAGVEFQGSSAYWSYNTCGSMDFYSAELPEACINQKSEGGCSKNAKCAWDGKQCGGKEAVKACKGAAAKDASTYGAEDCRCIGLSGKPVGKAFMFVNKKDLAAYPPDVGSTCQAWEETAHPECKKDGPKPSWCTSKWCFVDPCKCKSATPPKTVMGANKAMRFQGKTAYWSYETCGSKDTWSSASPELYCVSKKSAAACSTMDKCAWNGKECLGKALVETCQKQRETGVLGMEGPLATDSGAQGRQALVALLAVLGAMVAA